MLQTESLLVKDTVHPLDISTACHLAGSDSDMFLAIVLLSSLYRSGSLYVDSEEDLSAKIEMIFGSSSVEMKTAIKNGLCRLPQGDFFVKEGSKVYLKRSYRDTSCIRKLQKIYEASLPSDFVEKMKLFFLQAQSLHTLTVEQTKALMSIVEAPLGIITGGPGTGKTHIAGVFIRAYMQASGKHKLPQIALFAPTGKATHNLQKSIERAFKGQYEEVKECIDVKTIHSALQLSSDTSMRYTESFLPYHLIVVDEASMIDVSLLQKLASRIVPGTYLLLIGDADQLPPIEPGAVFQHIVQNVLFPIASLRTCLRCDLEPIVQLAQGVVHGKSDIFDTVHRDAQDIVSLHPLPKTADALIVRYFSSYKEMETGKISDHQLFRILCPVKEGDLGTTALNAQFSSEALRRALPFIPVIVTKNDYELQVMNGQMGLFSVAENSLFFADDQERKNIPSVLMPPHDFGFCLSVHKSQGSEFDHVVLLLPPGSEGFGRSMLYTAITRARKKIEIYGDIEVIRRMILQISNNISFDVG